MGQLVTRKALIRYAAGWAGCSSQHRCDAGVTGTARSCARNQRLSPVNSYTAQMRSRITLQAKGDLAAMHNPAIASVSSSSIIPGHRRMAWSRVAALVRASAMRVHAIATLQMYGSLYSRQSRHSIALHARPQCPVKFYARMGIDYSAPRAICPCHKRDVSVRSCCNCSDSSCAQCF